MLNTYACTHILQILAFELREFHLVDGPVEILRDTSLALLRWVPVVGRSIPHHSEDGNRELVGSSVGGRRPGRSIASPVLIAHVQKAAVHEDCEHRPESQEDHHAGRDVLVNVLFGHHVVNSIVVDARHA